MMRAFATSLLLTAMITFGSAAQAQSQPQDLDFKVFREGSDIGYHRIRFTRQPDGALIASVDINLQVKFAGITVFRYVHLIRETWRDGKLVAVDATTNDDGDKFTLEARAEGEQTLLIYQELIRQRVLFENHTAVLLQARELSVARRKAGAFQEAGALADEVYHRHRDTYGHDHPGTLAAAVTLANKMARIAWATWSREDDFRSQHVDASRHRATHPTAGDIRSDRRGDCSRPPVTLETQRPLREESRYDC